MSSLSPAAEAALDAVMSLCEKAIEAEKLGRYARSAELIERACAAASDSGVDGLGGPDSLVVASLQLRRTTCLFSHLRAPDISAADAAASAGVCWGLMCDARRTVHARIAARTLLPGSCLPAEVEFWARWDVAAAEASGPALSPALLVRARGARRRVRHRAVRRVRHAHTPAAGKPDGHSAADARRGG
jgi:hypothetical protein